MGYRSTVVLVVGKEVMPNFMAALSQEPEAQELVFANHDVLIKDYLGDGNLLVKWENIKWYEDYSPVAKIMSFINCPEDYGSEMIEEKHPDEFFKFCRIGEESTDTEEFGHGFWDVHISRSIEY